MQAVIRKVRSLSPFRRRKTARELIEDVEQKEHELMTELAHKRSNQLSAIEVMLDEESTRHKPMAAARTKSMKRTPSKAAGYQKAANVDSDTATPVTASTTDDSPHRPPRSGSPIAQLKRQQTFRDRFKRIRSLKNKREAEQHLGSPPPPPEIPRTVRGRSLRRDDERHDDNNNNMQWLPMCMNASALKAVASTEGVGTVHPFDEEDDDDDDEEDNASGPSKVSELSSPVTLQRAESLGNDSIAEIRDVLQKMERRLQSAERDGARISRAQVIKALMKVADSVDSLEERDSMYRELANLVERQPIESAKTPDPVISSFDEGDDDEDDDDESSEESSMESETESELYSIDGTIEPEPSPFDFFTHFGNFFSTVRDEKAEARQVLDDLLSFEKTRGHRDQRDEEDESQSERGIQRNRSKMWGESPWDDSSSSSDQDRSSEWFPRTASPVKTRSIARLRSRTCSPLLSGGPERRKVDREFDFTNPRSVRADFKKARSFRAVSSDEDSGATPNNAHQRFNLERLPSFSYHDTRQRTWRHGGY